MRSSRKFLVGLAAALIAACAREDSVEQQVRAVIERAEQGAEARDVAAVMALVSDDYADDLGYDKEQLGKYLRGFFVLNQSVHLLTRIENLEFPSDRLANVKATVGMLGTRGTEEDWSLAANLYEFDVELIREGNDWLVRRAEWRRVR